MTKQQILNHFKNGDVVECLRDSQDKGIFNEDIFIYDDDWCFEDKKTQEYIFIESNGKLARIIQHDKTEVYAQLGKEVLEILNSNPNDADAGSKIRKLYGK